MWKYIQWTSVDTLLCDNKLSASDSLRAAVLLDACRQCEFTEAFCTKDLPLPSSARSLRGFFLAALSPFLSVLS